MSDDTDLQPYGIYLFMLRIYELVYNSIEKPRCLHDTTCWVTVVTLVSRFCYY